MKKHEIEEATRQKEQLENNLRMLEANIEQDRADLSRLMTGRSELELLRDGIACLREAIASGDSRAIEQILSEKLEAALGGFEQAQEQAVRLFGELEFFEKEYFEKIRETYGLARVLRDEERARKKIRNAVHGVYMG